MDIFDYKKYETKKELFEFLKDNKDTLISQKKAVTKHADGCAIGLPVVSKTDNVHAEGNVLSLKLAINTTNVIDSHGDVHMPGLWDKSIKDNNQRLLLQEHKMQFDHIIAEKKDVIVSTLDTSFKDLGYDMNGNTQVLLFEASIKAEKNKAMYERYKAGDVDNHSVGMRYVKIVMAVNSEESWASAEKEVWDKYITEVANKEEAEDRGYFWVVKEAKVIEGSAVPMGSNPFTPTIKEEPPQGTLDKQEPSEDTPTINDFINLLNS
jgi:hypothetical protein